MQPTSIFDVKELCGMIYRLPNTLVPTPINSVVLKDNYMVGITDTHHVGMRYDTLHVKKPIPINSTVLDELFHTDKPYIGFDDELNYEFYDSKDDIPTPCI